MHMLTAEETAKMQSVKTSYVDICAESKAQAMEWGITTAGIKAAVTYLCPDYCYIFDTVPCGDVPDSRSIDNPLKLGGGAALMLAQHNSRYTNYAIAHPMLVQELLMPELAMQY